MDEKRRRSFESGHRPKFLVVVDDSEECSRAVYFAARRAARIGAGLVMLAITETGDFQHWLGVGEVMKAEAEAEARSLLDKFGQLGRSVAGLEPEALVRSGSKAEQILRLIEQDHDISFLVLAAGTGTEGPGPLVSLLAGKTAGSFPVPVVIVPGSLTDSEIDALA